MATEPQYTDRELADHLDIETGEMICNREVPGPFWPCHLEYRHVSPCAFRMSTKQRAEHLAAALVDEIQGKDNRIRNLRSLLARERLFRRQWQEEARRKYYRLLPAP